MISQVNRPFISWSLCCSSSNYNSMNSMLNNRDFLLWKSDSCMSFHVLWVWSDSFTTLLILFIYLPAEPRVLDGDEESIQCSPLLFKEDFLSDQYFGENQTASIVTEQVHFGEGMHRKAFRTTLREGKLPSFNRGHPCVLKVHNAISYGTKNNEELVQKNYSLAVEVRVDVSREMFN